jgi:hypothetical protein
LARDRTQLTERLVWRRSLSMESEEDPMLSLRLDAKGEISGAADKMMQQAWREWIAVFLSTGRT